MKQYKVNVQSEEIVPNGKGKVKGKVQKSNQDPKLMMQVGRPPIQKYAFLFFSLPSCFGHLLSLNHFSQASKVCMMD